MKNFEVGSISDIPVSLNLTLVVFLPVLAWLISRPEQRGVYADLIESLAGHSIDRAALESESAGEACGCPRRGCGAERWRSWWTDTDCCNYFPGRPHAVARSSDHI